MTEPQRQLLKLLRAAADDGGFVSAEKAAELVAQLFPDLPAHRVIQYLTPQVKRLDGRYQVTSVPKPEPVPTPRRPKPRVVPKPVEDRPPRATEPVHEPRRLRQIMREPLEILADLAAIQNSMASPFRGVAHNVYAAYCVRHREDIDQLAWRRRASGRGWITAPVGQDRAIILVTDAGRRALKTAGVTPRLSGTEIHALLLLDTRL